MKLIIVDDNVTYREGLKYYTENILNHKVIGVAADGDEFLKLGNIHEADIILMDIEMPNLNGREAIKKALWENSFLKFIAVTSYTDKVYLAELISAGFKSCVFKSEIFEDLENAIDSVTNNCLVFPKGININDKY